MSAAAARAPGLIGPNAITRVAQALPAWRGSAFAEQLFERAGLLRHWRQPPETMVHEEEVRALHHALRRELPGEEADAVARAAGLATADYLLAHRIPRAVQRLLRVLPAPWAVRLLLQAITRHAWTFAGSGHFTARCGRPVVLAIRHNPLCQGLASAAPACGYYAATFERLFQVLVHRGAVVQETACEACGDAECRFEIRW